MTTGDVPLAKILLLGPPGSGKSTLLGALAQAARTQGARLGVEVVDLDGSLESLRQAVYDGEGVSAPSPTPGPLEGHAIRLRPWRAGPKKPSEAETVVLWECAGPEAEGLWQAPERVACDALSPEVEPALDGVEALVLTVPADADEEEWTARFQPLLPLVEALQKRREEAREVAGLPVVLVLTRCDRLARPGDSTEDWRRRVQERQEELRQAFERFITPRMDPWPGFGRLSLQVQATAAHDPDHPQQPVGVAELFARLFPAAQAYGVLKERSQRRLAWTVRVSGGLVALALAALVALATRHPEDDANTLADHIRAFQLREGEAQVRLAARHLPRNQRLLQAFLDDPAFPHLPTELRDYVQLRLAEIQDYLAWRERLLSGPSPAECRSLEELQQVADRLEALALPTAYAWGMTEAAQLKAKWQADVPLIRDAVRAWENHYRDLIRQAHTLEQAKSFSGDWGREVAELLARSQSLLHPLSEPLAGSRAWPGPRGEVVRQAVPYEFDRVYQAREDWRGAQERLADLRDLSEALGLSVGDTGRPAVLDIPEPSTDPAGADLPRQRWERLRQHYPMAGEDRIRRWQVDRFPEPGRWELQSRVQRSLERGFGWMRRLVGEVMVSPPRLDDSPAGWQALADRLDPSSPSADPGPTAPLTWEPLRQALRDWSRLLTLIAQLADPHAEDPLTGLIRFLRQPSFPIRLDGLVLVIPDDLLEQRAVPEGDLTVRMGAKEYRLRAVGVGERRSGLTRYRFRLPREDELAYHPGEAVSAEVKVRGGDEVVLLRWQESRYRSFGFEALTRAVRGVRLEEEGGTALPSLPVLMPDLSGAR